MATVMIVTAYILFWIGLILTLLITATILTDQTGRPRWEIYLCPIVIFIAAVVAHYISH